MDKIMIKTFTVLPSSGSNKSRKITVMPYLHWRKTANRGSSNASENVNITEGSFSD